MIIAMYTVLNDFIEMKIFIYLTRYSKHQYVKKLNKKRKLDDKIESLLHIRRFRVQYLKLRLISFFFLEIEVLSLIRFCCKVCYQYTVLLYIQNPISLKISLYINIYKFLLINQITSMYNIHKQEDKNHILFDL